jgi:SepF-like predicted cell division protein (DUF552 family)
MRIPKTLISFIGKEFNDASWKDLCEQAAWHKIRRCTASQRLETRQRNLRNYFNSFNQLELEARDHYMERMMRQAGLAESATIIQQAKKNLETQLEGIEDETTQKDILVAEISKLTSKTSEEATQVLETLTEILQNNADRLYEKVESGRIYPWDRINFRVKKINLRELDEHNYKGPTLHAEIHDETIQSLKLKR